MAKKLEEIKEEQPYELPEGWKWVYGKRLFNKMESCKPQGDFFRYIDIDSIDNNKQKIGEPKILKVKDAPSRATRKLHAGDTIFSMVRPYLKNIAYIDNTNSDCIASSGFFVCNTSLKPLNNVYVYYLMTSTYVVDGLNLLMKGDNSPSIRTKDIEDFLFPLPPKETQQKIVDTIESLFAKLDTAQEKVEQVLAESENRRSAILHNAFSGKLTEKWRKENGMSFDSWNRYILKNVLDVRDGTHESPVFQNEGYPLITSKNLKNEKIIFNDIKLISKDDYDKINQRSKVEIGDILFAMIGTIGNPVVVDSEPNYAIKNVALLKNINKINPYFVKYYLLSAYVKNKMIKESKGSTQKFVSLGYLRSFPIIVPSLEEQQEIVRLLDKFLSAEDTVKTTCQNTLTAIATMRKSILAKAFRGELCS